VRVVKQKTEGGKVMLKMFDEKTVRKIMDFPEEEVARALAGKWHIPDGLDGTSNTRILSLAITYAEKKYPGRAREIGIFSTLVEYFTTGFLGGFGQEEDPLFVRAEESVVALAGGIPSSTTKSIISYTPPLNQDGSVVPLGGLLTLEEFTRAGIQLLENICFSSSYTVEDAIKLLDEAVEKMKKTKSAFKSKTIEEARLYVERAKEVLKNIK